MQAKLFSANTQMSLTIQWSIGTEWLQKAKHILAEKGKKESEDLQWITKCSVFSVNRQPAAQAAPEMQVSAEKQLTLPTFRTN